MTVDEFLGLKRGDVVWLCGSRGGLRSATVLCRPFIHAYSGRVLARAGNIKHDEVTDDLETDSIHCWSISREAAEKDAILCKQDRVAFASVLEERLAANELFEYAHKDIYSILETGFGTREDE